MEKPISKRQLTCWLNVIRSNVATGHDVLHNIKILKDKEGNEKEYENVLFKHNGFCLQCLYALDENIISLRLVLMPNEVIPEEKDILEIVGKKILESAMLSFSKPSKSKIKTNSLITEDPLDSAHYVLYMDYYLKQ